MHDAGAVRGTNRRGDLGGIREDLSDRQGPPRQALLQRLALDQFHHEVADAVRRDADVVERADVRVGQLRNRTGFTLQSIAQRVAVNGGCGGEDLDGDRTPEPRVTRSIHGAGPARAQRRFDVVWAKAGPWGNHQPGLYGAIVARRAAGAR